MMIITKVILHMLLEVCKAVHSCHANNVIHRDLKPENILLDNNGSVKLGELWCIMTCYQLIIS